jgi:hypothetical protein
MYMDFRGTAISIAWFILIVAFMFRYMRDLIPCHDNPADHEKAHAEVEDQYQGTSNFFDADGSYAGDNGGSYGIDDVSPLRTRGSFDSSYAGNTIFIEGAFALLPENDDHEQIVEAHLDEKEFDTLIDGYQDNYIDGLTAAVGWGGGGGLRTASIRSETAFASGEAKWIGLPLFHGTGRAKTYGTTSSLPDGTTISVSADGKTVTTTAPGGTATVVTTNDDGTVTTVVTHPDGSTSTITGWGGSPWQRQQHDGIASVVTAAADGSTATVDPVGNANGSTTAMLPDGTTIDLSADGKTVMTTAPDGNTTVVTADDDGTVTTVMTHPDGSYSLNPPPAPTPTSTWILIELTVLFERGYPTTLMQNIADAILVKRSHVTLGRESDERGSDDDDDDDDDDDGFFENWDDDITPMRSLAEGSAYVEGETAMLYLIKISTSRGRLGAALALLAVWIDTEACMSTGIERMAANCTIVTPGYPKVTTNDDGSGGGNGSGSGSGSGAGTATMIAMTAEDGTVVTLTPDGRGVTITLADGAASTAEANVDGSVTITAADGSTMTVDPTAGRRDANLTVDHHRNSAADANRSTTATLPGGTTISVSADGKTVMMTNADGTVAVSTTNDDGSSTTVMTHPDDSMVTTDVSPIGEVTTTNTAADGSSTSVSADGKTITSVVHRAGSVAITAADGSDAPVDEVADEWTEMVCADTPNWDDGYGRKCKWYAENYCSDGHYVGLMLEDNPTLSARTPTLTADGTLEETDRNYPGSNCCACGKTVKPFLVAPSLLEKHGIEEHGIEDEARGPHGISDTGPVGATAPEICTWIVGAGTGGSKQKVGKPVSIDGCYAMVQLQQPNANGATVSSSAGWYGEYTCYAEFGMSGHNMNSKYKTCQFAATDDENSGANGIDGRALGAGIDGTASMKKAALTASMEVLAEDDYESMEEPEETGSQLAAISSSPPHSIIHHSPRTTRLLTHSHTHPPLTHHSLLTQQPPPPGTENAYHRGAAIDDQTGGFSSADTGAAPKPMLHRVQGEPDAKNVC